MDWSRSRLRDGWEWTSRNASPVAISMCWSRVCLVWGEQAELALKRGCDKVHLFFSLWTIKEALIKALGKGFSLDVSGFEVPLAMRRGVVTSTFRFPEMPSVRWRLENLGNERFAAAIAHEQF